MPKSVTSAFPPFTVVVTSCGRFDLLRQTLDSLLANIDVRPEKVLVIEDSGDEAVRDALKGLDANVEVIVNEQQLGQMNSIDKVYAQVTTPYAFHCEDDWQFERGGFIAESFAILNARPDVSMVGLRPRWELNPLVRNMPRETLGEVEFFTLDPRLHPEYFSYSFNPGLRRMAEVHRFAPMAARGCEADVSFAFKQAGFRIANLEHPAVTHIGWGRHVDDPSKRPKARTILAKLNRSIRKRIKRLRRAVGAA
ncbi:glycosyltransferase family A protein [Caulobacter sp. 17J65-9]|uniref:glycosyltransferase family 2 protein n=1 Tax=Caulobacter sp. 17J65-9 TaxID=2709382 RepID=UPI0013C718F4|nr:glycosyltransferase family A protein [Caulobacter sp. 17J65-9]NEX91839.1 glycosyltransferase family 2 protein [Caulobacter sp. 17J65-9]